MWYNVSILIRSEVVFIMKETLKAYMMTQLEKLINIPSPTGYTKEVQKYLVDELTSMGYTPTVLHKGGVICELGGEGNPIMLASHVDTLGAVVKTIKSNGALRIINVGGLNPNNTETETVTVVTRFDGTYEGTLQVENASTHVNKDVNNPRSFDGNIEVLLDEDVHTEAETRALGIEHGDFICVNPRYTVTSKGYIKSRFLDDKASASVLLTIAKAIKENDLKPTRKIYIDFTVYEEVGHGGAAGIPDDVKDMIAVDMGCVGTGLNCTEKQVSICTKDGGGPYNYDLTNELVKTAKANGVDYAVDIYQFYGSDVNVTLKAGHDIRHGLIGPGVYASHGYERSHIEGLKNTYDLLAAYIG